MIDINITNHNKLKSIFYTKRGLIIRLLYERGTLTLSEIYRALKIPKETAYYTLSRLVEVGIVVKHSKKYSLSSEFKSILDYNKRVRNSIILFIVTLNSTSLLMSVVFGSIVPLIFANIITTAIFISWLLYEERI